MIRGLTGLLALLLATPAAAVDFRQPVNGDVVVTAYYDLGGNRDWNCGDHTYGGHRGTDIAIIGRFAAQDEGRDVVAAAPGRVTRTHDGEFDRCTTANCAGGGGFGNYVVVEHEDGKVTYYAHLRRGSVAVREGDVVACGQRLGQVGSSGFSTGPHLHFEVRVGGAADDPYTGPCGGPLTYWRDQGAYQGLPARECGEVEPPPPPPPPPTPDMHLSTAWSLPERACDFGAGAECDDFVRDGSSGGTPDAWVGETVEWQVVVHNKGEGGTQGETDEDPAIELQYEIPGGLAPVRYLIESDHPANDRGTWARNDAMENPANPAEDAPPRSGTLRLNGYSPGEAKRITLTLAATGRTIGEAGHARPRAWIRRMRGHYGEKTGWDDAVETNDGQTFNDGDLRIAAAIDVFDPREFLFDSPDQALIEGWRRCNPASVGELRVNTGEAALAIEITGEAPCVESPPVALPLAGVAGVRLRVRQHQGVRPGSLQWTTAEAPEFDEARSVAFETSGGGAFDDLHLGPGWDPDATLTRLRLMPTPGVGSGSPWFDIAEVRLVEEAPPDGPPEEGPGSPDAGASGPQRPDGSRADAGAAREVPPGTGRDAGYVYDPFASPDSPERARLSGGCTALAGDGSSSGTGPLMLLLLGASQGRRRRR